MGKQKVLALWGGPGSGKSTGAAYVFAMLKLQGYNVELVREYAKELAWTYKTSEEMLQSFSSVEICMKQFKRQFIPQGKVELIITDSPLQLSEVYGGYPRVVKEWEEEYFETYHVMVDRIKPYNPSGRFQTEEEAKKIDTLCEKYCSMFVNGDEEGYKALTEYAKMIIKGI